MACTSCGSKDGSSPAGCNGHGGCSTGGCNRLNTFDWLRTKEIKDAIPFQMAEISFKNGVSKDFFRLNGRDHHDPGDMVMVEGDNGWNIGRVNLIGELVKVQMKKRRISEKKEFKSIIRPANPSDLDKLKMARDREKDTLIRARAIAKSLNLDMKISEVEFQADQRKAVFYFIANGRVDFRELIKAYAREFRVKVEMKQIGSRQESALVGGIGACGRELCCSTWLTSFKSVNTAAARYQNLAINQTKLSGQCGRLKCCLNYELDMYTEALEKYPKKINKIKTRQGEAYFMKIDIFKEAMFYQYKDDLGRMNMLALPPERVREINTANKAGEIPEKFLLREFNINTFGASVDNDEHEEVDLNVADDLTGVIELPPEKKRKRRNPRRKGRRNSGGGPRNDRKNQNQKNPRSQNQKGKKEDS